MKYIKTFTRPIDNIIFTNKVTGEIIIPNTIGTYDEYEAPSKADALKFLASHPVIEKYHYIAVETPEGSWCQDIDGIYRDDCGMIDTCSISEEPVDCVNCTKNVKRNEEMHSIIVIDEYN